MSLSEAATVLRAVVEDRYGCNIGMDDGCAEHGDSCRWAKHITAVWQASKKLVCICDPEKVLWECLVHGTRSKLEGV